jgi:hypothetical protein
MIRQPTAIGFYPDNKTELREIVTKLLSHKMRKFKAKSIIVPHAGYIYSGEVAGVTYASIETDKKKILIACPNHTGLGENIALSTKDWQTPLGIVENAREFIGEIPISEEAHMYEHSLEVQLPFLQIMFKNFKLIPLCLSYVPFEILERLSETLTKEDIFYIASSDFTHFGPNYGYTPFNTYDIKQVLEKVREIDFEAIKFIEKLDAYGFYNYVLGNRLTICGFIPITLILLISKKLGAKKAKVIRYATSYDVTNYRGRFMGKGRWVKDINFVTYAGIVIY